MEIVIIIISYLIVAYIIYKFRNDILKALKKDFGYGNIEYFRSDDIMYFVLMIASLIVPILNVIIIVILLILMDILDFKIKNPFYEGK